MRRTGRVVFVFLLLLFCMLGLWMFQAWKEGQKNSTRQVLHNVYIKEASGTAVDIVEKEGVSLKSVTPVSAGAVRGVIADLYIQDEKITKIVKKPEYVTGTIQKIKEGSVVLDEYGELAFSEGFALYHISEGGSVKRGTTADLTVGQPEVRFIAEGTRICAAVVPEKRIDNIRVLLHDSDFSSYDHKKVVVSAAADFTVTQNGKKTVHKKGEKITFEPGNVTSDVRIDTGNRAKIRIESLKRQCGIPEYRGTLLLTKEDNKLHIVNEISLEEYLYSVVPSEMPTEYSMEALKAQAVCARSYAVGQMRGNRLAAYGAHVDDGVSFQVYNNQKEDARSIEAVNATKDQVVTYQGKMAATYFYSASCGSRAGTKDVWFTKKDSGYLPSGSENGEKDLSKESEFSAFIHAKGASLDADSPWYRWQTTISEKKLRESLEKNLPGRCEANATQIQVKKENGSFGSEKISGIGRVNAITVKRRGKGGVISVTEIAGSERTIRVYTEYNIRTLLGSTDVVYTRNDNRKVSGLRILPSGFFCVKKEGENFLFTGGGYGHGVGMSQNGADAMAKKGKNSQEILTFYFPGTKVETRGAAGPNE